MSVKGEINRKDFIIERYGPNKSVPLPGVPATKGVGGTPAQQGDFILTHSSGWYGKAIRFGEALRYRGAEKIFCHWSHAAIFVNGSGTIIEALNGGVQKRNISAYVDTEYVVVHLPEEISEDDRAQAVKFAEYSLKQSYGWLTIISIAISMLTASKLNFGVDGQQICSALVARCIERTGEIFVENEPWHLMPADLAKHFNVTMIGDKGTVPPPDCGVKEITRAGT